MTEKKVDEAYTGFIECQGPEYQCCRVSETTIIQHYQTITQYKKDIWKFQRDKRRDEIQLEEMEHECPDEWKSLEAAWNSSA